MADTTNQGDGAPDAASKARAEFERYKERMAAKAPGIDPPAGAWHFVPVPSWAAPPSLAGMPGPPWAAAAPMPPYGGGTLRERLETTLRLGVDVVNAMLAGGMQMMVGRAYSGGGPNYGYGAEGWHGCRAEVDCCCSCCADGCGCCRPSCCCDDCCRPSVRDCC